MNHIVHDKAYIDGCAERLKRILDETATAGLIVGGILIV
jgi:hypothetical protein